MSIPVYAVLIDWDADGTYTDEVSRLLAFNIRRGRDCSLSEDGYASVEPGFCSLLLDDYDNRYNPFNTSSALYPYVLPNRKIKIQEIFDGVTKNLYTGFIRDIHPESKVREVRIDCYDGIDWLQKQKCTRGALHTGYGVHQAIVTLVEDAGWPFSDATGWTFPVTFNSVVFGGSAIENNGDTIPYWWADPGKTVWEEISEIAKAFAGDAFVASDGTFSYNSRLYVTSAKLELVQDMLLKDLDLQVPWRELRNDIAVIAYPRQATAADSDLWCLNDTPLIGAGATLMLYADFQYQGDRCAASSLTTLSATTDYTANTLADGSGTSKTDQLAITVTAYASSAKLEIKNNDAAGIYVTLLKLRGVGLYAQSGTQCLASDATSISTYGQLSLTVNSPWMQEVNEAQNHASYAKSIFTTTRKVIWLRADNRPEIQFVPDLFDVLSIDIDKLEIDGNYTVTSIEHEWNGETGCITTWRLEPVMAALISDLLVFPVTWNDNNIFSW